MKIKKILAICIVLILISSFMTSCVPPWVERNLPTHFLGSTWESKDKLVRFTVNLDYYEYHFGTIKKGDNLIEMVVYFPGPGLSLQACSIENYEKIEPNDYGYVSISNADEYESYDIIDEQGQDNYFTIKVENSSIYNEGEEITFYRVDETKDIEVVEFACTDYLEQIENHTSNKEVGDAKDIKSAISKAKSALEQEFGPLSDELEVYYDDGESCWLVKGTLEHESKSPHIIFHANGNVIAIWA